MFEIKLRHPDGEEFSLFYNQTDSSLVTADGTPALPYYSGKSDWRPFDSYSPENPIGKSREVKKLKIQLGLSCNYSCTYCNQAMHVGSETHTRLDDVSAFLDGLDEWLVGEPSRIEFWGGEPLVYWKKLKLLVPALRERFPNALFTMITNGSLLDDEKFAFIDRFDIAIGMSHDGPGQHLRGPDPFEEPGILEVVRRFIAERPHAFSINAVITADNADVNAILDWFRERVHPHAPINFEGVVNHYEEGGLGVSRRFTAGDYERLVSTIKANLNDAEKRSPGLEERVYGFLQSLVDLRPATVMGQKCGMDRPSHLAVDLKGNAMTCQNTGVKGKHGIGSVFDMENVKLDTAWHWKERPDCGGCPYLQICGGGCMYLTDKNWVDTCNNEYHYAKGIFEGALEMLTGAKVIGFYGEHTRPTGQGSAQRIEVIQMP